MTQFVKNETFSIRAVSISVRPDGTLKASEPSVSGIASLPDGTQVVALEPFKGGEWLCRVEGVPALEGKSVRVDRNKIMGSAAAVKYVQGRVQGTPANGKGTINPIERLKAAKAAKEQAEKNLAAAAAEVSAAQEAIRELAAMAKELEEATASAPLPSLEEMSDDELEAATA